MIQTKKRTEAPLARHRLSRPPPVSGQESCTRCSSPRRNSYRSIATTTRTCFSSEWLRWIRPSNARALACQGEFREAGQEDFDWGTCLTSLQKENRLAGATSFETVAASPIAERWSTGRQWQLDLERWSYGALNTGQDNLLYDLADSCITWRSPRALKLVSASRLDVSEDS